MKSSGRCPFCKGDSVRVFRYSENILSCKCVLCGKTWTESEKATTGIYPIERSKWNADDGGYIKDVEEQGIDVIRDDVRSLYVLLSEWKADAERLAKVVEAQRNAYDLMGYDGVKGITEEGYKNWSVH